MYKAAPATVLRTGLPTKAEGSVKDRTIEWMPFEDSTLDDELSKTPTLIDRSWDVRTGWPGRTAGLISRILRTGWLRVIDRLESIEFEDARIRVSPEEDE